MASKFAARLAREMKRRELSYDDFAHELGISKSQLHDWVHEKHQPNLASLRSVASKLGCRVMDLIEAA